MERSWPLEIEPGVVLDAPALISWKFAGCRYGSLEVVTRRSCK